MYILFRGHNYFDFLIKYEMSVIFWYQRQWILRNVCLQDQNTKLFPSIAVRQAPCLLLLPCHLSPPFFLKYFCIYAAQKCHSTPLKTGEMHLVLLGSSRTAPQSPRGPKVEGHLAIAPVLHVLFEHTVSFYAYLVCEESKCWLVLLLIYLQKTLCLSKEKGIAILIQYGVL